MKKIIALLLFAAMFLSLGACSVKKTEDEPESSSENSQIDETVTDADDTEESSSVDVSFTTDSTTSDNSSAGNETAGPDSNVSDTSDESQPSQGPEAGDTEPEEDIVGTEGLTFALNEDNSSYYVKSYAGSTADVVIPNKYEGLPVTAIGDGAFYYCNTVTSFSVPNSVISIGASSFYGCEKITEIKLPKNLETIGDGAFFACSSLISLEIPKSVTKVGLAVAAGCASLEEITVEEGNTKYCIENNCLVETDTRILIATCNKSTMPDNGRIIAIAPDAFYGRQNITDVVIPNSVTEIGSWAFMDCNNLKTVAVPATVEYIGAGAFSGCDSLVSISVDAANPIYHSMGNCLIETSLKTLISAANNCVIPDDGSVTIIGNDAFYHCKGLSNVVLPSTVTEIGTWAFGECENLANITIPDSVTKIGEYAFYYCKAFTEITVPATVTEMGQYAFSWCENLKTVNCEAMFKPSGWDTNWVDTSFGATVEWDINSMAGSLLDENLEYYADITIKNYGTVKILLASEEAPITVENFINLAESGFYNGLTFHRIMEGFMMQGGCPNGTGTGGSGTNIVGEFSANGYNNTVSHVRGVISMARATDYNSGSSQFFIVHEDSTFLDGQYAAFGWVTSGMEVVDAICTDAQPTDDNGSISAENQPVIEAVTISTQPRSTNG